MKVTIDRAKYRIGAIIRAESRGDREADFLLALASIFKVLEVPYGITYTMSDKHRMKVSIDFDNKKLVELIKKFKKYEMVE